MSLAEGTLFILYLLILLLAALRFLGGKKGRVSQRLQAGRAMTVGDRQIQEDACGICQSADAFLAVLADGMGRHYGGRVSSRTAVDTIKDMILHYRRSEAPAYFFRRAFHQMNRAILEQLDDGRGGASVGGGADPGRQPVLCGGRQREDRSAAQGEPDPGILRPYHRRPGRGQVRGGQDHKGTGPQDAGGYASV